MVEDNCLKEALKRATRVTRFTECTGTKKTPFKLHFGRKPRTVFNNLLNLENEDKELIEQIYDSKGDEIIQLHYNKGHLRKMSFDRSYGKSASTEDLKDEMKKREVSKIEYFVVKKRNRKDMDSMYEDKPKKVVEETRHTVFDGVKTYHEKT